jgi:deazaflavin-dependent oxidoreductase (nitroreductase family)
VTASRRVRVQRLLERYVANPLMRTLLRLGLAPRAFALLETTGRRTGLARVIPVGGRLDGGTYWLVAEHGRHCGYVANLASNPACRVQVARRWRSGTATLLPDDDGFARRAALDRANGWVGRLDGLVFRAGATTPMTVRIDIEV